MSESEQYLLKPGYIYLVKTPDFYEKNSTGINYFINNIKETDNKGLAFVREKPEILKKKFIDFEDPKFELCWVTELYNPSKPTAEIDINNTVDVFVDEDVLNNLNINKISKKTTRFSPVRLESIVEEAKAFMKKNGEHAVLYADALTYLIKHNGFDTFIRNFKDEIYDAVKEYNSLAIFVVNPHTLDSVELANLEIYLNRLN